MTGGVIGRHAFRVTELVTIPVLSNDRDFFFNVGDSTNGTGLESRFHVDGLSLENEGKAAAPCPKEITSGVRVRVSSLESYTTQTDGDGGEREATVGRRQNNVAKAVILRQHQIRSDWPRLRIPDT